MREVGPLQISAVLDKMRNQNLSSQMIIHVFNLLHKLFQDAIELFQLFMVNPAQKRLRPKLINKESDFLSYEECLKLLDYSRGKPYGLAIWIQLLCGLRAEEVQYLRSKHIDLDRLIIKIEGVYSRRREILIDLPKGYKISNVPISHDLEKYLREVIFDNSPGDWICSGGDKSKMLQYGSYLKSLKRYCVAANVKTISTHGLRHSASVIWKTWGATDYDIKNLLTHSSLETTKRYLHDFNPDFKRIASLAGNIKVFK